MMKLEIGNQTIAFDIQYGNRKRLAIQIEPSGFVIVKAPKNTSEDTILNAVQQKSKWILNKLELISEVKKVIGQKEYQSEGNFFYLGKKHLLHELIDTSDLTEEVLKTKLKKFYMDSCKKIILERIKIYEKQLGVKPKSIDIVDSKTYWGSCHSNKKITFNYRLAMAPSEVIDYVIIHELCHLIHMNHDRSFWRCVGSVVPDYKKRQQYLRTYGPYMTL